VFVTPSSWRYANSGFNCSMMMRCQSYTDYQIA
jgi:hypothetical protein